MSFQSFSTLKYPHTETVKNSERDWNTRPPDLHPEKSVMHVKKQQLELDIEQRTGSNSGRGTSRCIFSPCLFNLYAEYIMRKAGLDEAQAGNKILGEISVTSDMQMTPPLWQKVKRN